MPSDLASYLAANYLTAEPKPSSKKRKRKHAKPSSSGGGGLVIHDDEDDWGGAKSKRQQQLNDDGGEYDDNGDLLPVTVGGVKEFRKTTKANWKTIGGGGDSNSKNKNNNSKEDRESAAAADAVLAAAAAAARAADEDAPAVVTTVDTPQQQKDGEAATMADGSHAGLQSAAAVTAQLARRQRQEREQFEAERRAGLVKHGSGKDEDDDQTYYRDATGRRVDVSMQRAEARRAAREAEDKERAKVEALKGEVQVEEARRRREALAAAKTMSLARTADDEEMNREMREQRRWNDPMARFLGAEDEGAAASGVAAGAGGAAASGKPGKKAGGRRPVYKGAAPPNRYGIRPGYRWDGVDRSNGFEAERFKALNRRERNKGLEYSWQMDE